MKRARTNFISFKSIRLRSIAINIRGMLKFRVAMTSCYERKNVPNRDFFFKGLGKGPFDLEGSCTSTGVHSGLLERLWDDEPLV